MRKNCDIWQGIEREPQSRICGSDLPGCGPLVSFETSVGKTLEPGGVIDADIKAIYETAAAVGLNEREMDGVEIVFASRKHSEILPSGCSGYYQYKNGRHCIKIRCDKDAAKTARHELQHMADEQDGVLYEDNRPAILNFASAAGERIENCCAEIGRASCRERV